VATAVGPALRGRLTGPEADALYARWLAARRETVRDDDNPVRRTLDTLRQAAGPMDLTAAQREVLEDLIVSIGRRADAARRAAEAGVADAEQTRQAAADMERQLGAGIKQILTPGQFQELRSRARSATRPSGPSGDRPAEERVRGD
jgi:hypothetical protein